MWFRRALRVSQHPRSAEDKFRAFLGHSYGIRLSDYERMDKDLQAAINDKYAYVFLRDPLEERIRQFIISPRRTAYCHAPGCEWRVSELTAFEVHVRRCVRCEHYQVRGSAQGGAAPWQDITREDYEFLVVRDEAHRAQWDAAPPVPAGGGFDPRLRVVGNGSGGNGNGSADNAMVAAQSEFDTAPRR